MCMLLLHLTEYSWGTSFFNHENGPLSFAWRIAAASIYLVPLCLCHHIFYGLQSLTQSYVKGSMLTLILQMKRMLRQSPHMAEWRPGGPTSKHAFLTSILYSFNRHLLSTYYVPDTVRGTEDTAVNKRQRSLPWWSLPFISQLSCEFVTISLTNLYCRMFKLFLI